MTTPDDRTQNGQVVLAPEHAADLGLRGGEALPVTIARPAEAQDNSLLHPPFLRWVGACRPLPGGRSAVGLTRELRGGDAV